MINGRTMKMASLDVCNFILDNMPGPRWVVWRTANGESFKKSLVEHIASSIKEVQPEVEEVSPETKASTLKKAFRTLNIDGRFGDGCQYSGSWRAGREEGQGAFGERYGSNAANDIPKRHTIYGGRPYLENTYFMRDKDLIEQSVRTVIGD